MKREILEFKFERKKRRADFLFNDGEFRPRTVKNVKSYTRKTKHKSAPTDDWNA